MYTDMRCRKMHVLLFNDTATTEIYTLSLHDALPILLQLDPDDATRLPKLQTQAGLRALAAYATEDSASTQDRKSTRLKSSHANISSAPFSLKKKYFEDRRTRMFVTYLPLTSMNPYLS